MAYEFIKKLFGKTEDGQPEALTAEALVAKIEADQNLKLVNLTDGGYVSKDKFDAKETELSGVKKSLDDANATIKSYTDMDVEGIKKSSAEWEEKYNADTKALKDQLDAQERSHQTDMFLSTYKYTSKAAQAGIRAEFEKQGFKLKDGVFQGAADYMKGLMDQEDYKGAFVIDKPDGDDKGGNGGNGAGNGGTAPQTPLPQFATGTNGGVVNGSGSQGGNGATPFDFGFQHIVEPPKAQ